MNFYSSSSTNVTKLKHKQPYLFQKIMKIVRNFLTYLWFNFVFHGQILKIKNVKKIQIRRSRFDYESESEYYSSYKKSRIRIRIFGIRRKRFESESESEYSLQHCIMHPNNFSIRFLWFLKSLHSYSYRIPIFCSIGNYSKTL